MRLAAYSAADVFAGAERVLADLLAHLDPAIDVIVLGPDAGVCGQLIERRPGARWVRAGGITDKRDIAGMWRWVAALRAVRPDILQLNLAMPWASLHETVLALAMPGLRVVALEHAPLPFDNAGRRRIKPLLAARLAAHVAVGEQAARDIERFAGLPAGSIRVIPVGVEPFDPPARDGSRAGPRIGTIARLSPLKRLDDLLRALAVLPGVALEIVGDGQDHARLAVLAGELGVSGQVRFAGWSDDARSWLGRWDVFVLPSAIEGPSLAILDAMLAELPVVATAVGSVPEAVRHEQTGLLVGVGDPPALAAAIARVLGDPALARRLGVAARTHVLAHNSVTRMAADFEALYAELRSGAA